MSSPLKDAIIRRDREGVEQALSVWGDVDDWSLSAVIDELMPFMLMESNLRYSNFHLVKMGLFLRELAMEGHLSPDTERAVARVVALEVAEREWVGIHADRTGYTNGSTRSLMDGLLQELHQGNIHNAFYYALGLLEEDRASLIQTLLLLATDAVPKTLGHTLSCFFPVMKNIVAAEHPETASAVLSYLMYLGRYGVDRRALQPGYGQLVEPMDYDGFLKVCASGDGIVNLHHMITLYIAMEWEQALFNENGAVPYALLQKWVGVKPLDRGRMRRASSELSAGVLPDTYEDFAGQFSPRAPDALLSCLFRMLDEAPRQAVDWIFRLYASHYLHGSWNPHYYTGLYAALRLYMGDLVQGLTPRRMALDQAVHYFAQGMVS